MDLLAFFADIIKTLAWPVFAYIVLSTFRKQVEELLGRIKKGKIFGQELELTNALNKLNESALIVEKENILISSTKSSSEQSEVTNEVNEIINKAAQSPKAALLLLASDLESEANQLLAFIGQLKNRNFIPLSEAIDLLNMQRGGLPENITISLQLFRETRNKLIHGRNASNEDILRAIDSGITILKALKAYPHEINIVCHNGVDIFHDAACKNKIENIKGIILETESPDKMTKSFRILFPSTRQNFVKRKQVSWEWIFDKSWKEAWYKDPDTGEIKMAWSGAAEFIGRNLEEI